MRKIHKKPAVQRRVHAIGAYGFGNFGDELFVATIRENASSIWPEAKVRTFAFESNYYASPGKIGKILRLVTAVAGFLWADTIAMCGGSTLEDVHGIARLRDPFLKYRTVEALGVSVGPFGSRDAELRVARTLKKVRRIVVRDKTSIDRLKDMLPSRSAALGGDLVALSSRVKVSRRSEPETIIICPSAAADVDESRLKLLVTGALSMYQSEFRTTPRIVLLALSQHPTSNDIPVCESLQSELSQLGYIAEVESYSDLGLDKTCSLIATAGMVWTYRLHGAVVAYLAEVPFFIIGHHEKCIDFGDDIGLPSSMVLSLSSSWEAALISILKGAKPAIEPDEYRKRARSEYLKTFDHTGNYKE